MEPRGIAPLIPACHAGMILFHQGPMADLRLGSRTATKARSRIPFATITGGIKPCLHRMVLTGLYSGGRI